VPVEGGQTSAGGCLGRPDRDEVAVGDALLLDQRDAGVEVDVGPPATGLKGATSG
jgi:hypothetical protein